ncbi:MAG TPA: pilus assembly protein TadG-related protein [Clostridiales bacterium]|nr:pilus assembly protein TadG-related protein [Clostridiales bacterium]HXK82905.1 pilus assembly protein TadG-related protein [Clostridiales bacterium]
MKKRLRSFWKEESGVAVIFVAISMVVLMSFTALAVDYGMVYYHRSELQTALDSAALAAAQKLPDKEAARRTAIEYVRKNGIEVKSDDEIIVDFLQNDTIVRVSSSVETKTSFARIFNVDTIKSVAVAAAQTKEVKQGQQSFDHLLFSGSRDDRLFLDSQFEIFGSVHTNNKFFFSPSNGVIHGEVSAVVPGSSYNGGFRAGSINPNASYIPMPDFSDSIAKYVPPFPTETAESNFGYAANKIRGIRGYVSPAYVNSLNQQNITLEGKTEYSGPLDIKAWGSTTIIGEIYVKGSASFQGKLIMNSPNDLLCVDGDLNIGGGLFGKGTLIVDGDLTISGGGPYTFDGDIYVAGNFRSNAGLNATGKIVCKGNMNISQSFNFYGPSSNIPGVIYCDGNLSANLYKGKADIICQGTISFTGNSAEHDGLLYSAKQINVYTRLISNNITILSKDDITVNSNCTIAKGVIYAGKNFNCYTALEGSVYVFAENNLNYSGYANNNTQLDIAFYAINGNISISLSKTNVTGIIYAPKGNVHMGGSIEIYGSIIANSFTGSFSKLTIRRNENGNPLDVGKTVKRTVLVQ